MANPFFTRPAILRIEQLEKIERAATGILEDVGISVGNEWVLERLRKAKFRVREANRVRIEPKVVGEFLAAERARGGNAFSTRPRELTGLGTKLTLGLNAYNLNWHDVETGSITPITTARLTEAVKICEVLRGRGLSSTCPGTPMDVPGKFQSVLRAGILATHSAVNWCEGMWCAAGMPYELEIGEILGHRVTQATVYVFSPLHLGGESLECAVAMGGRLEGLFTGGMPSAGSTASIHVGDAFALSAAESIGSAILLQEAFARPTGFAVSLYAADMGSLAMVFGSPESLLMQWASAEVNAWFHGEAWYPAAGNIHTNAKCPGEQAAAEKAAIMTTGALLGARGFSGAGSLSLDEIFSLEQLLYDIEIKDQVERLTGGLAGECDEARAVADARAAVQAGSFAGLDSTAEEWRKLYWTPRVFDRDFLAHWRGAGSRSPRDKVRSELSELLAQHDYHLEPDKQRAIDAVVERARARLV